MRKIFGLIHTFIVADLKGSGIGNASTGLSPSKVTIVFAPAIVAALMRLSGIRVHSCSSRSLAAPGAGVALVPIFSSFHAYFAATTEICGFDDPVHTADTRIAGTPIRLLSPRNCPLLAAAAAAGIAG